MCRVQGTTRGFLKGAGAAPKTAPGAIEPIVEKEANPEIKTDLDLDKLAHAVSMAETGGCKDGTAIKRNNCFGIMSWPKGVRTPKWYATQQESFEDFKRIWMKSYKRFPDLALARRWTGNDNPQTWLNNVIHYYNKPKQ